MQNRTTGRYAVGVQLALAPLIAGAASTVPTVVGCAGLLALAGWFGSGSEPLVAEQHTSRLPGWQAVVRAREEALLSGRTVVVESELHPFASYLWHLSKWRGNPNPPKVLSPWDPEPWAGIDGSWVVATVHRHLYPDGLKGREEYWGGVSNRLHPLTQQRFLEAWSIEEPPLPLVGWWPTEKTADGRSFMWGGALAEMQLPPMVDGTEIGFAIRPAPGSEPLRVLWNGEEFEALRGDSVERRLWHRPPPGSLARPSRLQFTREHGYPPGGDDARPLAVQLFEMRSSSPTGGWAGPVSHGWQRAALRIEIEGVHDGERFPGVDEGVWLWPRAVMRVPATSGRLRFRLWAPRPTPPRTRIRVAGRLAAGPLEIRSQPAIFDVVVLPGEATDGRLEVEILSEAYRPADDGTADSRELGVVISGLEFEPDGGDPVL